MRTGVAIAAAALLVGCGGGDAKHDASAAVQRYFAALGHGDAAAACHELSDDSRHQLGEFGGAHLHADTCEKVVTVLLSNPAGANLRRLGSPSISRVEIDGDRGEVYVKGLDRPVKVVHSGGHWQIDSSPTRETD